MFLPAGVPLASRSRPFSRRYGTTTEVPPVGTVTPAETRAAPARGFLLSAHGLGAYVGSTLSIDEEDVNGRRQTPRARHLCGPALC